MAKSTPLISGDSTWWTMIDRASDGDEVARTAFADEYADVIHRTLAVRWRGRPLAQQLDDAVQDVFLDCLKDQGALGRAERGRSGGFGAFLRGVITNVALRYERSQGRHGSRQRSLETAVPDGTPSLASAFDRAWLQRLLTLSVKQMRSQAADDGAHRRVDLLAMRFGDNLPIRVIAQRWGMSAETVHVAYARARREFRRVLHDVMRENTPDGAIPDEEELDLRLRLLLDA